MTAAIIVFWVCAGLLAYHYVGFPLLVYVVSRMRPRPVRTADVTPRVTMIVAAFNEESVIRDKCENCLNLDYPREQLEIIVAADGSTDQTVRIVEEYADRGIRVLHEPGRKGKTSALNRAATHATGDVLFFSDANTIYDPDTLRTLMRNFADPDVGGVCGRKVIRMHAQRTASRGENAFWSYESFLKGSESLAGSIATADGEIFAMRRDLFQTMPAEVVHDDMFLTLRIVEQGHRVVYEPDATSAEYASKNLRDEFHLKVRYASAGYQILTLFQHMLLPPRSWFAAEFLSHKLLRWAGFALLIILFAMSAILPGTFYHIVFLAQIVFYLAAFAGWLIHGRINAGPLYFPLYFAMGNLAGLYGFARWMTTGQQTQWRRAER
jgi:cellulose synthase/poly-beta-1,6-N-acetylglucosamine synthase-like glycosyltransferase